MLCLCEACIAIFNRENDRVLRQIVVWEISGKNVLGNLDGHEPVQVVEAHEKRVSSFVHS